MDLWKGYELSRTYVPAAYYTITSIKSKNGRANPLHDEVLGRKAYVVYLEVGERGFIKYLPDYDDRYHCLHTSTVLDFTPWGKRAKTQLPSNSKYGVHLDEAVRLFQQEVNHA